MPTKEEEILELLKQGKSYSYIQAAIQVSPSKIASVKKTHFESDGRNFDSPTGSATSSTTENTKKIADINENGSDTNGFSVKPIKNSDNKLNKPKKKQITMNTDNFFDDEDDDDINLSEKAELLKLKMKMEHEISMKKFEKENDELNIRKRELLLKEEKFNSENRKTKKSLVFRFRKLAEKIEDGDWPYEGIVTIYKKTIALKEEIELYCFENDLEIDGLKILVILKAFESEFESFLDDDASANDEYEITFEDEIHEMVEDAQEVGLDDYE